MAGGVIRVSVGNWRHNVAEKQVSVGLLLMPFLPNLQYMSASAMLHMLSMTARMLGEMGLATRQVNNLNKMIDRYKEQTDPVTEEPLVLTEDKAFRTRLMDVICEFVMRAEGHGRLHGFAYVKTDNVEGGKTVTGTFSVNPEMDSVNFL